MGAETNQEFWQVETSGESRTTTFAEMTQWIEDGSLERLDRVRKGNLRWIEAGKVPSLAAVFNAKDNGHVAATILSTTKLAPSALGVSSRPVEAISSVSTTSISEPDATVCSVHPDRPKAYVCDTCLNAFCKVCPNSYGSSVKICPMCGAMCSAAIESAAESSRPFRGSANSGGHFDLEDIASAFGHPFRFKVSLILGAMMFSFISLGQSATAFGGIFMLSAALFCYMLANMLTFGILANTAEQFSQGKIESNFMPSFDDFGLWDDVIQPFFLSISAYLISFGPLAALLVVFLFFILSPRSAVMGETAAAANSVKQAQEIRGLVEKQREEQVRRISAAEDGSIDGNASAPTRSSEPSEADFERLNQKIQAQRKTELESTFGKTPETSAKEQQALIQRFVGYGVLFLVGAALLMLWGLFYFPAACTVAGYTQSIGATLNPGVGFDTIKRLGLDYIKLLGLCLLLLAIGGVIGGTLAFLLSAFDLPGMGNVLAKFITSFFTFYLWTVFACCIGRMLYKASDRLQLPV